MSTLNKIYNKLANKNAEVCHICARAHKELTVKFVTNNTASGSMLVCSRCRDKWLKYVKAGEHPNTEGKLQKQVMNLNDTMNIKLFNIHGDKMQARGTPDILGTINGRSVAFELKVFPNFPTSIQLHHLKEFRKSNGHSFIIYNSDQAVDITRECLG